MQADIKTFHETQTGERRNICEVLALEIQKGLPEAEHKIWHGSPTWFLDGNPIVAYNALKDCIRLFFWSGQSFEEQGLRPSGSFKAAERRYRAVDEIDSQEVQTWLKKAREIQWDYGNIRKNKGLVRL